ncbi:hypothetical protein ARMSODRAFT_61921 [Armillaria solidipes]|uniref:Uncharacterized protein n=1 Tax=Armillaria solidipes TaxID=1076256 RepID=A0A2H3BN28_9AGAR|nr:hypothetical protein ARMSODRAFT_61921 [Armillaria solidipes]
MGARTRAVFGTSSLGTDKHRNGKQRAEGTGGCVHAEGGVYGTDVAIIKLARDSLVDGDGFRTSDMRGSIHEGYEMHITLDAYSADASELSSPLHSSSPRSASPPRSSHSSAVFLSCLCFPPPQWWTTIARY